jgi:hypothetical protein
MKNVRPPSRICVRCFSRSAIAWRTSRAVSRRTPPRLLRTRSTDAVDGGLAEPGLLRDLSDPEWVTHPDPPEGFLMVFCA